MTKKKTVNFYTQEQLDQLLAVTKDTRHGALAAAARFYSREWKRTPKAIMQKLYAISHRDTLVLDKGKEKSKPTRTSAKSVVQPDVKEVGVELPKGMTFEGTPKKVILYKDHFRVYL